MKLPVQIMLPVIFAVTCSQQQIVHLRAEIEHRNAVYRERVYQSFIEKNRESHAQLQAALLVAVRAEFRHEDCEANECWCTGRKVMPLSPGPDEWGQMKTLLTRVQPLLKPNRETLVPSSVKIWRINEQGKPVYTDYVRPSWDCFNPGDCLVLYEASGKRVYELKLWSLTRESRSSESTTALDRLVLSDDDFHYFYSLPTCRRYINLMPNGWKDSFR